MYDKNIITFLCLESGDDEILHNLCDVLNKLRDRGLYYEVNVIEEFLAMLIEYIVSEAYVNTHERKSNTTTYVMWNMT